MSVWVQKGGNNKACLTLTDVSCLCIFTSFFVGYRKKSFFFWENLGQHRFGQAFRTNLKAKENAIKNLYIHNINMFTPKNNFKITTCTCTDMSILGIHYPKRTQNVCTQKTTRCQKTGKVLSVAHLTTRVMNFQKQKQICSVSCWKKKMSIERKLYLSCSPPAAEYALVVNYQFWQPTFPCWLRASWERVDFSWHHHMPYWANGLFYPSWNRLYRFTTYR